MGWLQKLMFWKDEPSASVLRDRGADAVAKADEFSVESCFMPDPDLVAEAEALAADPCCAPSPDVEPSE